MNYLFEALIIGAITAVVGFFISTTFMYLRNPEFSLKNYSFWPWVLLGYFVTGATIHIFFEKSGGNLWYCKNGSACVT
jgi:hypothetical protein